MGVSDMEIAVEWAALEGWNPGIDDAEKFRSIDPDAFLVGRIGDDPAAVISNVRYDSTFSFLGFYIVRPDFRGQGYGLKIWNAAIQLAGNRTIGLDGVVDQQSNYKKSGFDLAYRNIRQEGKVLADAQRGSSLVPLENLPFAAIEKLDRPFFPAGRQPFLHSWIQPAHGTALAAIDSRGDLTGYGVIRQCRNGWKIGPLFATISTDAERLFVGLQSGIPSGARLFLDTPEINKEALALAARYQMNPVFETARMYRGEAPTLDLNGIFGVTSFELG